MTVSEPRPIDATVTYSVADLLAGMRNDMNTSFARIEEGLKGKADKTDLATINGRLDEHSTQIAELKRRQDADDTAKKAEARIVSQRREWHRWLYPTLLSLALVIVGLVQAGVLR